MDNEQERELAREVERQVHVERLRLAPRRKHAIDEDSTSTLVTHQISTAVNSDVPSKSSKTPAQLGC